MKFPELPDGFPEAPYKSAHEQVGELLAERLVRERDRRMLEALAAAEVDVRRVVLVEGPDGAKALGVGKPDGSIERICPLYRIYTWMDGGHLHGRIEVRS